MKKQIFLLFIILIMTNCSNEVKKNRDTKVNSTKVDKMVKESVEDFNIFLEKFFSDSSFRVERIKFPLKGYNSDQSEGKRNTEWNKVDWEFYSEDDFNYKKNGNIKTETIFINQKIKDFRLFKKDSGYDIKYTFVLENGIWVLKYYSYKNF